MMFRNLHICVVCSIRSNGKNTPACITGIDSSRQLHSGPASDWSPIMGKADQLRKFSDRILEGRIHAGESKR